MEECREDGRVRGGWKSSWRMEGELNNSVKGHTRRACVGKMKCGEVEKQWEKFIDIVLSVPMMYAA